MPVATGLAAEEVVDTVKGCLRMRKRGLDVKQARRMVQERSVWRGFVRV